MQTPQDVPELPSIDASGETSAIRRRLNRRRRSSLAPVVLCVVSLLGLLAFAILALRQDEDATANRSSQGSAAPGRVHRNPTRPTTPPNAQARKTDRQFELPAERSETSPQQVPKQFATPTRNSRDNRNSDSTTVVPSGFPLSEGPTDLEPSGGTISSEPHSTEHLAPAELDELVAIYESGLLFKQAGYEKVRSVFARRFARRHARTIDEAWGPPGAGFRTWLDDRPEIRDELYTAVDEEHDSVADVLRIFRSLAEKHPAEIETYANLAIATAVVWDTPKSVYSYEGLARQAEAPLPPGETSALDNFEYFLATETAMQGRPQWLPWEFLVHLVNHTTPLEERQWALARYLPQRVMFGKCYHDVEYDHEALDSDYEYARLNGQTYTLPNLDTYGGVCAYQADFASRVGQSIGVPAAYVRGASQFGESHAWVMWVEVRSVDPRGIRFTLESYGRYRLDKYYVGTLREPQTGQTITDRQLELRLHAAGRDPAAKRQADFAVAAMAAVVERLELDAPRRFAYVSQVIELCPVSEPAWVAASKLVSHPEVQARLQKKARETLDASFKVFASFPDFTWQIFGDLVAAEPRPGKRIALYERLVAHYQQVQRPDLACEALLRLCDLYEEAGAEEDVVAILARAILAIPEEGRYVPRLLDRLEAISARYPAAVPQLLDFYARLIPRIPTKRGDRPSEYAVQMYERAAKLFRKHGQEPAAQHLEGELAKVGQPAL